MEDLLQITVYRTAEGKLIRIWETVTTLTAAPTVITATLTRTTEITGIMVTTLRAAPMGIMVTLAKTTAIQVITAITTTVARKVTTVVSAIPTVIAMDLQPGRYQPQGPGQ
jgi:hypothetical protein